MKWPCTLFHSVYNKNFQLELYTCQATATNYINRTAATITNSSQFTCLNTAPNVDEKRWEEKRKEEERQKEDSKRETWRAACNLLHPKLSGDAPPRRVVAANPPSRESACEGQSGRGAESNRLARGHRASALWNHLQTCVLTSQVQLIFVPIWLTRITYFDISFCHNHIC